MLALHPSPLGRQLWDSCERTTRQEGSSADAVVIFALLRSRGAPPATLLVRQFRPPIGCDTLELPAGLIDPGESAAEAALRELKEETGFTATLRSVSPAACMSPGLTSETVHFVTGASAVPGQAARDGHSGLTVPPAAVTPPSGR